MTRRPRLHILAFMLCCTLATLASPIAALAQQEGTDPAPTGANEVVSDRAVSEAFARGDFQTALRLLEAQNQANPKDPFVTYNLACCRAMLLQEDAAAETLIDAISYGFVDFHHLERDKHLEPLRGNRKYQLVIKGWRELLDARAGAERDAARDALGEGYRADTDDAQRLSFVWAIDPGSFEDARRELGRVSAWASANVFGADGIASPDANRPDPWVMILLPTPRDFARLVGVGGVGGYYDRDHGRLVTQDIGPSLRHEYFHVLHWRQLDRLGQRHPLWVMEGLASLLEDVDEEPDGSYTLAPSWRTNIARRLERANRLTPWKSLFSMPRDGFMGDRSRANYAQARCIFMFLHERGVLKQWYESYLGGFEEDPTGALATERALGVPLKEAEREFRSWLRELPDVAEQARPGEAWLGFEVGPGAGDGLVVLELVAGSGARIVGPERLMRRDVITSIDGRPVRTLDDLHRVLGESKVGQRVELEVRRGSRRLQVALELVARAESAPQTPY